MRQVMATLLSVVIALGVLTGCSLTPEGKLAKAKEKLASGRLTEARMLLDQALGTDSTDQKALYGRALVDEYLGYDWDALIAYLDASKVEGGFTPAMDDFCRLSLKMDYIPNGYRMARLLQRRIPDKPDAYLYLAGFFMRQNMFDSAHAYVDTAATRFDDETLIRLYHADIDLREGIPETVNATMDELKNIDASSPEHLAYLATLYENMNMGAEAIAHMERAVAEDEENVPHRLRLAWMYFNERRALDAYATAQGVMETAEDCGPAYIVGAYAKRLSGMAVEADKEFSKFVVLKEQNPLALDKYGDMLQYFKEVRTPDMQWQSAYILALNKEYPDDYIIRLYDKMLNAYIMSGDVNNAMSFLKEGLDAGYQSEQLYFFKAELMHYYDEMKDSIKVLIDDQLTKNWTNSQWLDLAARVYLRTSRYDEAETVYRRLLTFPQPKTAYYTSLLRIFERRGDADAADSLAKQLPLRFRNSIEIYEKLCDVYRETDRPELLRPCLIYLHERSGRYLPYIIDLAEFYAENGETEKGRQLFAAYAEIYPDNAESHYRLGRYEYDNDIYDSLTIRIDQSLAIDSAYGFALELKGLYFQAQNQPDSVVYYFNKVVAMNWPSAPAFYYLGNRLYQKRDSLDRAAGLAMGAVRYFDTDRRGYLLLGDIYTAQEKYRLARTQYYKGIRLVPDDAELHFKLGKTYAKLGEKENARRSLEKALSLDLPDQWRDEANALLRRL